MGFFTFLGSAGQNGGSLGCFGHGKACFCDWDGGGTTGGAGGRGCVPFENPMGSGSRWRGPSGAGAGVGFSKIRGAVVGVGGSGFSVGTSFSCGGGESFSWGGDDSTFCATGKKRGAGKSFNF